MNLQNLIENDFVDVNSLIIANCQQLKIDAAELGMLLFLHQNWQQNKMEMQSHKQIADKLTMSVDDVRSIYSRLLKKGMFEIITSTNNSIISEIIDFTVLYRQLAGETVSIASDSDISLQSEIVLIMEKEIGRLLSPMEIEYIRAWANVYERDMIIEAIKEAIINDVKKLTYIDKILQNWHKNGRKKIRQQQSVEVTSEMKSEFENIYFNWLDDENKTT